MSVEKEELMDTYFLYDKEKHQMDELYENHFYKRKFDDDLNDGFFRRNEHASIHKKSIYNGLWYPGKSYDYFDETRDLLKLRGLDEKDADAYVEVLHNDILYTFGGLAMGYYLSRRTKVWWEGFALSFPRIRKFPVALPVIQGSISGFFGLIGLYYISREGRSTDDALGAVLGNSKVMIPRNAIIKKSQFDPTYIKWKADHMIKQFEKQGLKLD